MVPFICFRGEVALAQTDVQVITRPNVVGVDTRIFPKKGRIFELVGIASAADETSAMLTYSACLSLKASGLQTFVRNGLDYETEYSQKVKVIDVPRMNIQTTGPMAGNVGGSDRALLMVSLVLCFEVV